MIYSLNSISYHSSSGNDEQLFPEIENFSIQDPMEDNPHKRITYEDTLTPVPLFNASSFLLANAHFSSEKESNKSFLNNLQNNDLAESIEFVSESQYPRAKKRKGSQNSGKNKDSEKKKLENQKKDIWIQIKNEMCLLSHYLYSNSDSNPVQPIHKKDKIGEEDVLHILQRCQHAFSTNILNQQKEKDLLNKKIAILEESLRQERLKNVDLTQLVFRNIFHQQKAPKSLHFPVNPPANLYPSYRQFYNMQPQIPYPHSFYRQASDQTYINQL